MQRKAQIDSPMHQPAFTNHRTQVKFHPDEWTYQKESVINGGMFGNLMGFDSLETQYALFGTNNTDQQISTTNLGDPTCNVLNPPLKDESKRYLAEDDLRFGLGKHQNLAKDYRVGGAV